MRLYTWLVSQSPETRLQAQAGRAWLLLLMLGRNPLAVMGILIITALVLVAVFAPWIAPETPVGQNLTNRLQPPSGDQWMGTDELGRDIFSRVVYGSRITLLIVVLVAIISAPLGLLIGAVSGYFGGLIDRILMGVTDVFLSMPKLILALAFVAALGPGIEDDHARSQIFFASGDANWRADRRGRAMSPTDVATRCQKARVTDAGECSHS